MTVPPPRVTLGSFAPPVSTLGLGCAALPFDLEPDPDGEASRTIRAALRLGINLVDTSPMYVKGRGEQGAGAALRGVPRETYVLSTKVGYVMDDAAIANLSLGDGREKLYPSQDFSYDFTLASVERSLEILGQQRIDIVHLHDPKADRMREIVSGAARALRRCRDEGLIGAIGAGVTHVSDALAVLDAIEIDCMMIAGARTLLVREGEAELLPRCAERDIPVILAGPFNSGLLADPHQPAPRFRYRAATTESIELARRLAATCDRYDIPLKAAALQFPLRHPAIRLVMTGPSSVAEIDQNVSLLGVVVPEALWRDLETQAR